MVGIINDIIDLLEDGKPHTLLEVAEKTDMGKLDAPTGLSILNLLELGGFITQDRLHAKIQATFSTRRFWKKIKRIENMEQCGAEQ